MLIYRSEVCADLEGPEVRVDREDVDQLEGGEDVGGSEESLKHWVVTRHHIDKPRTSEMSVGSQVSQFSRGRLTVFTPSSFSYRT